MNRINLMNSVPDTYEELTEEQKKVFDEVKRKHPDMSSVSLIFCAYFGEENVKKFYKIISSPIPTQFFTFTLSKIGILHSNDNCVIGTYFNLKEVIEALDNKVCEDKKLRLEYCEDFTPYEDFKETSFKIATSIKNWGPVYAFYEVNDYYVTRSLLSIYPDTQFIVPELKKKNKEYDTIFEVI